MSSCFCGLKVFSALGMLLPHIISVMQISSQVSNTYSEDVVSPLDYLLFIFFAIYGVVMCSTDQRKFIWNSSS